MKLRPLENTVVHLPTREEYDEYMRMCEEAGLEWWGTDNKKPFSYDGWSDFQEDTCVQVMNDFDHGDKDSYLERGRVVVSLSELKKLMGDQPKRETPEPWTPVYERGSDKLTQDLIFTAEFPDGISPDDLKEKANRYRALLSTHARYFQKKK